MIRLPLERRTLEDHRKVFDALAIDRQWDQYQRASPSALEPLTLDMSRITYIQHDCLLYLGALIGFRHAHGTETLLELPDSPRTVDYLRSWAFPEFIEQITARPFEETLAPSSRARFEQLKSDLPRYVRVISTPGGGVEQLLPRAHFALTAVTLRESAFKAASLAQERWLERHLLSVLDSYLGGEGRRVATHVIMEAVLNAASHPKAGIAFTSSQFIGSESDSAALSRLEIGIWDDGDPFGLTLQRAIKSFGSIRSPAYGTVEERFTVRLIRASGQEDSLVIHSRDPNVSAEFPLLTICAFLIGVTSLPGLTSSTSDEAATAAADLLPHAARGHGGLGLYLIRRTVIDLFGGRLRYMSASYRLTISAGREPGLYDVLMQYRPDSAWPLQGNLLLIEIPIAKPEQESPWTPS